MKNLFVLLLLGILPYSLKATIKEKTFVVWVTNVPDDSRGGAAISLDNNDGVFDAIVFGEIMPGKWMAGSEYHNCSQKKQDAYPVENGEKKECVQIAVTYSSERITLYRNG